MRVLIRGLVLNAWIFLGIVTVFAAPPSQARAQSGDVIRQIVVEGAQRIEPDTVRSYMRLQEGDRYSNAAIDRALKNLFDTGLFADVAFHRQGDALVVNVVENPVINRIAFEGNRRIEDEDLESEVTLRPRVIYTRTKVQNDVKRVLTLYRRHGRFAATVEPKVIQLEQNRVDLVFEINEGPVTEIRAIRFIGNETFGDARLRDVIRTRESRWYRFFSSDDNYDPDRMTYDQELLRRFYLTKGHADFRVVSAVAELTPDREAFFLTFAVDEGIRYRFGDVRVVSTLKDVAAEPLAALVALESGTWYDADAVEDVVSMLTDTVNSQGHAFAEVRPRISRNRDQGTIDVVFEVGQGPRVFVERIEISGNVRTQDEVIRREFELSEGDPFNSTRFRQSKQNLRELDFFEKVEVERVPGSAPDKTVVDVEVEEKSTGALSIGLGYSTTNGGLADLSIRERNLLGKGQDLKISLVAAQRKSQIDLSFTEPYFLDRDIRAGFDVYHITRDLQDVGSYDSRIAGGALRIGYALSDDLGQGWRHTVKRTSIVNIDDSASRFIKAQAGNDMLSELSHTLTYDKRDSRLAPTEGYLLRMTNDLAGLGGSTRYMRNSVDAAHYWPLADQWVFAVKGGAGYIFGIGQDIKLPYRFFVGGDDLRGFATSGVGPRDKDTRDALGGEWMYVGTAEVTFPLGLPNEYQIAGKLFSDFGSSGSVSPSGPEVKDSRSLRASVGTGVTWVSPFGPIGVDFGVPVLKEGYDETELVRVNFGTRF